LRGGVDDLDVFVAEGPDDVVELVGRRGEVVREGVVDLVVGQKALALADLDERLDLFAVLAFARGAAPPAAALVGPAAAAARAGLVRTNCHVGHLTWSKGLCSVASHAVGSVS